MFLTKKEVDERGGTNYVEFQLMDYKENDPLGYIALRINWFKEDSLFVHDNDMWEFDHLYAELFEKGIDDQGEEVWIDRYDDIYFSVERCAKIIVKIQKEKPQDHEILIPWLKEAIKRNGFYVLGI